MDIIYQNTNITDMVVVHSCVIHDTCGDRCDSLDIEFENAGGWFKWGPKEDDTIVITHDGYTTCTMYVNTVLSEDNRYRIVATSLPCIARVRGSESFYQKTIRDIMRICGARTSMGFQIFGIDGNLVIPYAERDNEECGAFLNRLLTFEGAKLKCVGGKYTAIGISYAQNRPVIKTMQILATQKGVKYMRTGTTIRKLTGKTANGEVSAEDLSVPITHAQKTVYLPASTNLQAGRWARGMLLHFNQSCEALMVETSFLPSITSLLRVDIIGDTDANGEWIVNEVTHDIKELKTTITLNRCFSMIR